MTSRPDPRRTLLAARQATWVPHTLTALVLLTGLLLLVVAVAIQVREDDGMIWAPRPPASSPAPHVPL